MQLNRCSARESTLLGVAGFAEKLVPLKVAAWKGEKERSVGGMLGVKPRRMSAWMRLGCWAATARATAAPSPIPTSPRGCLYRSFSRMKDIRSATSAWTS